LSDDAGPALKLRAIRLAWRMFSCPISGMKSKNFVQPLADNGRKRGMRLIGC
jgi:hypothetical protein